MPKPSRTALLPVAAVLLLTASGIALSQSPAAPTTTASQPVISEDSIDDFAELNRNLATLGGESRQGRRAHQGRPGGDRCGEPA